MRTVRRRIHYTVSAIFMALCYFVATYNLVYLDWADKNKLITAFCNLALIILILIEDKLESYAINKINSKIKKDKHPIIKSIFTFFLKGASFKTSLYCFYTGLLICYMIVRTEPDFPVLGDMSDYFTSVYYGILVLFAADKFLGQVFKDVDVEEGSRDEK